MLPSKHIIASIPLGVGVWYFTESILAGALCFLSGLLLDIDHILEYLIHFGFRDLNPKEVYSAIIRLTNPEEVSVEKIYLPLHAAEIAILLWLVFPFTKNIFLLSVALGYTVHLIMDSSANILKPKGYFISYRMINSFRKETFIRYRRRKNHKIETVPENAALPKDK